MNVRGGLLTGRAGCVIWGLLHTTLAVRSSGSRSAPECQAAGREQRLALSRSRPPKPIIVNYPVWSKK